MEAEEFNSGDGDGGPWISANERELVFHSRRPGGTGGWDLWRAFRLRNDGIWLHPEPVAGVNTAGDERYPLLAANGTRLIFSRRAGPGLDEELWFSHLQADGTFGPAAPLPGGNGKGPRMAATSEESDGAFLWVSLARPSGAGDASRSAATPDALDSSGSSLSASAGGALDLSLDAGDAWAGSAYAVVLGASGPVPGARFQAAVMPLAGDRLTAVSLSQANWPPLLGFQGRLDAAGRAAARLALPAGSSLPGALLGRDCLAAFLAADGDRLFVSNAVAFGIRP